MPITEIEFPILQYFFCSVESRTGMPAQPLNATDEQKAQAESEDKSLPKGVVIGPDGKPCRTCTSGAAWRSMMKTSTKASSNTSTVTNSPLSTQAATMNSLSADIPSGCPPDVEELGRSTWTFLHTLTASYPTQPTPTRQQETKQFISLFSQMYPCWSCAEDFRSWMSVRGNEPRVSNREEFGRWMCEAHNEVNKKLGKREFDCGRWEERWRTGWKDGSCD